MTILDLSLTIICILTGNPIWVIFIVFLALGIMPLVLGLFTYGRILKLENNSISITKRRMLLCFNSTVVYNSWELNSVFLLDNIKNDDDSSEYFTIKLVTFSGNISVIRIHGKNINLKVFKYYINIINDNIKNNKI